MKLGSNVVELEDVTPLYCFICYRRSVLRTRELLITTVAYPDPESSVSVPLCVAFRWA
jgi:hypothetical protein